MWNPFFTLSTPFGVVLATSLVAMVPVSGAVSEGSETGGASDSPVGMSPSATAIRRMIVSVVTSSSTLAL